MDLKKCLKVLEKFNKTKNSKKLFADLVMKQNYIWRNPDGQLNETQKIIKVFCTDPKMKKLFEDVMGEENMIWFDYRFKWLQIRDKAHRVSEARKLNHIRQGENDLIKKIKKFKIQIHSKINENLIYYLLKNDLVDVQFLVETGTKLFIENSENVFIHAISKTNIKVIEKLLKYPELIGIGAQNHEGNTALMEAILMETIPHEKIETARKNKIAKKILDRYLILDSLRLQNNDKQTALILAIEENEIKIAEKILEYPQFANLGAQEYGGFTALMYAINTKQKEIAKKILEYPQLANLGARNRSGETTLMIAIRYNEIEIAKKILDHPKLADVGAQTTYTGRTALMYAINTKQKEIAKKILEYPDLANLGAQNSDGNTALMMAIKNNQTEIAKKILDHPELANLGARNRSRETALELAADSGSKEITRKILKILEKFNDIDIKKYENLLEFLVTLKKNQRNYKEDDPRNNMETIIIILGLLEKMLQNFENGVNEKRKLK